jgi:hypothetical protein
MRWVWTIALAATVLSVGTAAGAAPVSVVSGAFTPDTTGAAVQAHGGGIIKVGQYYYWFGENRNADGTFRFVSAYRSTDLRVWEFRNHVLRQSSAAELNVANIERPKVIFNAATNRFVMWMHKENGSDYSQARAAVAVSSTVDGNYTYLGSFRPMGTHMSRDITAYVDTDGAGYMISAARDNLDLHVYRLTADFTGVATLVRQWVGDHREAPALFKRNGVYFMLTSAATGWSPNQQRFATATSLTGTWSGWQDVGNATAFGSQTAFVLPVQGTQTTSYLYLGDRWAGAVSRPVNESRYVWLPLRFPSATTMAMDWYPQVSIDTATGTVAGQDGPLSSFAARHSGKCADVVNASTADGAELVQFTCGSGTNQRWTVVDDGDGYVHLVARHSGKCLDVNSSSTADGAKVAQYTCHVGRNQQFQLQDAGGGYVRIVARHSGKCLDVSGASTANSARVVQWACNGGTNQQWQRR